MNKVFIAMSIAAGISAIAHAENTTTLYGSLGYETQIEKNGGSVSGTGDAINSNVWSLNKATSKFGIKGTEDLSSGTQAFFKFELGVDPNNAGANETRYAYIGLRGDDWGQLTFGKQDALYNTVVSYNDIFQDAFFNDGLVHFETKSGGPRLAKALSYVSPNWSGFQFGVAGVLDGQTGKDAVVPSSDSKNFDAAQVGAWYNANGFYAGVAYSVLKDRAINPLTGQRQGKRTHEETVGGSFGYSNDQFKVGLGAEHAASIGEVYNLAGEYYYGPNTFRAGFGYATKKAAREAYEAGIDEANKAVYTYALGYQYNFSKRTYAWLEGQYVDYNKAKSDGEEIKNGYTVRVGLRHDF